MIRCLHLLPMGTLSGAEKMTLLICRNLKAYEPIVVCGGDKLCDIFKDNGIKCLTVDFQSKNMLKTTSTLRDIIKKNDVKLIHCHDNTASVYGYMTKKLYGLDIKVISHVHNCYPFLKDGGINKVIDKKLRRKYDFNIACGSQVYEFYKKYSDYINEDKFKAISNAMDIDGIQNKVSLSHQDVRKQYGIPDNKKILGFIGRLDEQKGMLPFIEAVANHKSDFLDSVFLIVGSGSEEKLVKDKVKALGLEELFIFTGFDTEVYKYYKAMNLFFLPSRYEGLPMVLLEAMAAKVPVISMNVGSIGELLEGGRGILIEKGDYEKFVTELIASKDNKNAGIVRAERGYEYLKANYGIKKYIKSLEAVYSEVL